MGQYDTDSGTIESRDDFEETPKGQYKFYAEELKASE